MQELPLVSIIITNYNRDYLLARAVNSALNQTYKRCEIIVIDDGSTNNPGKLLEKWIRNNDIIFFQQENKGTASAKNTGIRLSSGEYLVFLDSDDFLESSAIEDRLKVFTSIRENDLGLIFTDYYRFLSESQKMLNTYFDNFHFTQAYLPGHIEQEFPENKAFLLKKTFLNLELAECLIHLHSSMFLRDVFLKVGNFDESWLICEDWEFFIRVCKAYRVACSLKPTSNVLFGAPHSLSKSLDKKIYLIKFLEKQIKENRNNRELVKRLQQHRNKIVFEYAYDCYKAGRKKESVSFAMKDIIKRKWFIKSSALVFANCIPQGRFKSTILKINPFKKTI